MDSAGQGNGSSGSNVGLIVGVVVIGALVIVSIAVGLYFGLRGGDQECTSSDDCPSEMICENDTCKPGCSVDSHCESGRECVSGKCEDAGDCSIDSDCQPGQECVAGTCEISTSSPAPFQSGLSAGCYVAEGASDNVFYVNNSGTPCRVTSSQLSDGVCDSPTAEDLSLISDKSHSNTLACANSVFPRDNTTADDAPADDATTDSTGSNGTGTGTGGTDATYTVPTDGKWYPVSGIGKGYDKCGDRAAYGPFVGSDSFEASPYASSVTLCYGNPPSRRAFFIPGQTRCPTDFSREIGKISSVALDNTEYAQGLKICNPTKSIPSNASNKVYSLYLHQGRECPNGNARLAFIGDDSFDKTYQTEREDAWKDSVPGFSVCSTLPVKKKIEEGLYKITASPKDNPGVISVKSYLKNYGGKRLGLEENANSTKLRWYVYSSLDDPKNWTLRQDEWCGNMYVSGDKLEAHDDRVREGNVWKIEDQGGGAFTLKNTTGRSVFKNEGDWRLFAGYTNNPIKWRFERLADLPPSFCNVDLSSRNAAAEDDPFDF